jgi:hypothetical protein
MRGMISKGLTRGKNRLPFVQSGNEKKIPEIKAMIIAAFIRFTLDLKKPVSQIFLIHAG